MIKYIDDLRIAIRSVHEKMPFKNIACVVLPEHMHAIWELPDGDSNYSKRWMMIKQKFVQSLLGRGVYIKKNNDGSFRLWQRRYWEHVIRNEQDLENHINYIHYNPVKHGLVLKVKDWPYSSVHRHMRDGLLERSWGEVGVLEFDGGFGER